MPHTEKSGYWIVNALLLLASVLIFAGLQSCNTFRAAQRKFATNVADTTYTVIRTTVPRDSAVIQLVTDTTTVYREIRQGRARIIYQRDSRTTTVKADCDSAIVEKKVPVYVTKQVWGIDPKFKTYMEYWRTATFGLLFVLIALGILYVFRHMFLLNVNVSRRQNGAATEPN